MRNKKIADRLLIVLLAGFSIVMYVKINIRDDFYTDMVSFVIEAALVGGIADWFAVTALYKKPLGFPWHTAIIPRNREKVIEAVANVVEHELLSQKTLKDKIDKINFINILIKFIDDNLKNSGHLTRAVQKYGVKALNSINTDKLSLHLEERIKNGLKEISLPIFINKVLSYAIENNSYEKPFIEVIDYLISKIEKESTQDEIYRVIGDIVSKNVNNKKGLKRFIAHLVMGVAEETNSVNLMEAADSIQKELAEMLVRLKDINDPLHVQMIDRVKYEMEKLRGDEVSIDLLDKWKMETIKNIIVRDEIKKAIENIISAVRFRMENGNLILSDPMNAAGFMVYSEDIDFLMDWVKLQLQKYWKDFKINSKAQSRIDAYIKEIIYKIIKAEHSFIGVIVKKSLSSLTDDALNDFIERKAGNDLHWIRINGCIVGAAFGLVVYLFLNLIYIPVISRIFHIV